MVTSAANGTRVLLLQVDGKLPNVALMRIAAHHRALDDSVELRRTPTVASIHRDLFDRHDRVYASAIFERSRPVADRIREVYPGAVVGGTGVDLATTLEGVGVTTLDQDYSVYPGFSASIGFTQRGCRLRCPFCVVPAKEGAVREEQTIASLWRGDPHPRHLHLLDNDFFGQPRWQERVAEIRDGGFRVCFSQGINARVIDEEVATAVASVDYRDDSFKVRRVYTAWDSARDEARLFRGLDLLVAAGVKPDHVMVYMLVGYWAGETATDREHRRARLRDFGARPYPMPYKRSPELLAFQRWVVGAYDKTIPWSRWMSARGQPQNLTSARQLPLLQEEAPS